MKHSPIPLILVTILSGCCTTVDHTIGTPARPEVITSPPSSVDQINRVLQAEDHDTLNTAVTRDALKELLDIWAHNDLALKQYAKNLEARIELHDNQ